MKNYIINTLIPYHNNTVWWNYSFCWTHNLLVAAGNKFYLTTLLIRLGEQCATVGRVKAGLKLEGNYALTF